MLHRIGSLASVEPRLAVFAYDIASPRRARRVRAALQAAHSAAQYSVYEVLLTAPEFRGLLAETASACCLDEDRLAVWWPRDATRIDWLDGRLRVAAGCIHGSRMTIPTAAHGAFNFVVCYDVSNPSKLRKLAAKIAGEATQLQRSVYWLRMAPTALLDRLTTWGRWLDPGDRLWAYPLRRSADLWQVGGQPASVLPMATHHWNTRST